MIFSKTFAWCLNSFFLSQQIKFSSHVLKSLKILQFAIYPPLAQLLGTQHKEDQILWFIVVRSHQTYIHYLDQASQGFHQSPLNYEGKQLSQTLQGEQPNSNPYKPKCFPYLQLNKSCYKRICNKWSLDDQITHI